MLTLKVGDRFTFNKCPRFRSDIVGKAAVVTDIKHGEVYFQMDDTTINCTHGLVRDFEENITILPLIPDMRDYLSALAEASLEIAGTGESGDD